MKKGRRPRRRPRLKLSDKAGPDQCPVPGENALFPAQIAGFLAVSRAVPVYPVFLNYVVPVHLIPLVEVIKTEYVSEETVSRTFEILRAGGKRPVLVQKDVPGFLANRLQHALFREAISIVEKGIATPQDVDEAIKYGFGMRVGISAPFEVMDMGGLDLTNNIHSYLFPYLEDTHQAQKLLTDHIAKGELGFKTSGHGFVERTQAEMDACNKNLVAQLIKVARALERL